jgi:hypothetical protein
MSFKIDSFILYRREMALKLALFVIFDLLLLYLSNSILQNKMLSILFLIIAVSPIIFLKEMTKKYSYRANFILEEQKFLVIVHKNNSGITFNSEHNLRDIKSYSIQFPNRKLFAIKFNFKLGNFKEYSILKEIDNSENVEQRLISAFHSMMQLYNKDMPDSDKIHFNPSFYASFYGLLCIVGFLLLFVILITLQIILKVRFFPITIFFGLILLLQIIIRRKSDIDYYKKIVASYNT